jgi:hypothetical protein
MYLYLLCIFFLSTYISLCLLLSPFLFFVASYLFFLSHVLFFFITLSLIFYAMFLFYVWLSLLYIQHFSLYLTLFLLCFSLSACFIFFISFNLHLTEIPFPSPVYLHFYNNTVYQINSKLASDPVWELAKPRKPQTMDPPTEYIDCLKAAAIPGSNFYTRKCAYSQDNSTRETKPREIIPLGRSHGPISTGTIEHF